MGDETAVPMRGSPELCNGETAPLCFYVLAAELTLLGVLHFCCVTPFCIVGAATSEWVQRVVVQNGHLESHRIGGIKFG